eukprot:363169-Chlamydomonas_euryale.AAC.46
MQRHARRRCQSLSLLPACCTDIHRRPVAPVQHFPHTSFNDEVDFLDANFASVIGSTGRAYVLGDPAEGLQWHKYVAGCATAPKPTYNVEICMTELCEQAARQYFRTEEFVSAQHTTKASGILALKPRAMVDDYVFEPCGYSMNGIEATGLITIHITPESGFSYASVEVSGHAEDVDSPDEVLGAVLRIFKPGKVAVALSVCRMDPAYDGGFGILSQPAGYICPHASAERLECGGAVTYYNMVASQSESSSPRSTLIRTPSILSVHTNLPSALSEDISLNSEEMPETPPCNKSTAGRNASSAPCGEKGLWQLCARFPRPGWLGGVGMG